MGEVNKYGVDIDDLREEMTDIERRSARGPFWTPQGGKNVVRILPSVVKGVPFYHKMYGHWVRSKSTSYPCLTKMRNEKCFLCEEVQRLREGGDRKAANGLSAGTRYYMQLIDRKAPEAGIQIFNTGATVFKGIVALLDDEDWGPKLLDLAVGYDLVIERTGEGLDTKYPSIRARKDPSAVEVVEADFLDLATIADYYTYEEMQKAIAGDSVASTESVDTIDTADTKETASEKSPPKKEKLACYKQYDSTAQKCQDCPDNFDCEIDTPAS